MHRIERRIRAWRYQQQRIRKLINLFFYARIGVFIIGITGFVLAFGGSLQVQGAAAALVCAIAYLVLMVLHDRCYRFQSRCEMLEKLAIRDLARSQYRFKELPGDHLISFEDDHPFAHDMDFSGANSLLKLLDNSFHLQAQQRIKTWIDEAGSVSQIRERQEAVADLTNRRRFRSKLALACHLDSIQDLKSNDLDEWLAQKEPWTISTPMWILGRITAAITTGSLALNFIFLIETPWVLILLSQGAFFYLLNYFQSPYALSFMTRGRAVASACGAIGQFERIQVKSTLLQRIRDSLRIGDRDAGDNLKRLLGIHEMLQYRENGTAHLMLNVLFMWDQHYLRKLHHWRMEFGDYTPGWIDAIFEIEALSAVANYRDLFPRRPFPEVIESEELHIVATDLGHPCIPEGERVGNDYQLIENGHLHLITGSNMSGKSTFMRTIGANLALTRLGAPVCAKSLTTSLPRMWSSIKIQDSLADGVSYFYAEVKRLKIILDAVAQPGPPTLYLLDEILKGTNSRERLIACKALMKYLIQHRASGLITTHDLELIRLADEEPDHIANYHFQEHVRDDEMFFDYKLKTGELTGTNALRVMSFAGVPLKFDE